MKPVHHHQASLTQFAINPVALNPVGHHTAPNLVRGNRVRLNQGRRTQAPFKQMSFKQTPYKKAPVTLLAIVLAVAAITTGCSTSVKEPDGRATPPAASVSLNSPQDVDQTPPTLLIPDAPAAPVLDDSALATTDAAIDPVLVDDARDAAEVTMPDINGDTTLQQNVTDTSNARPARLVFQFGFNQVELDEENKTLVEQHGRFIAEHPELTINVHGHADTQGNSLYNEALSQQRARYVGSLLQEQGVAREQIHIVSWGSAAPLAAARHNRDNRRVELQYNEEFLVHSNH